MKRGFTGHLVPVPSAGESCRAFVPNPLLPEPSLDFTDLQEILSRADLALGRLDGFTAVLPDPAIFLYSYVRKEALLSSQIEGTQGQPILSVSLARNRLALSFPATKQGICPFGSPGHRPGIHRQTAQPLLFLQRRFENPQRGNGTPRPDPNK